MHGGGPDQPAKAAAPPVHWGAGRSGGGGRRGGRFSAGLVGTAVLVPGLAAFLALTLYVYRANGRDSTSISGTSAYLEATLMAIGTWFLLGAVLRNRLTSVKTANPSVYHELLEQYERISSRMGSLEEGAGAGTAMPGTASPEATSRLALAEARAGLETCRKELGLAPGPTTTSGMDWVLATGYAALWRRIHAAQEALLLVEPVDDVVGQGLLDEARLESSTIPGRDQLLRQVRMAVGVLAPGAQVFLAKREEAEAADGVAPADPGQARMVIRNIAHVISEYRDDRQEGLIRARNNVYRTVFIGGLAAYILLGLALIREVDELALVAMSTFYLVGAIVGLFRQLGKASSVDTVKQGDYGLSTARLLLIPLFSGLAAVGGVVLVALLGAVIPAKTPAIPTLRAIFDLGNNQFGLVGASVFGLTPNLLIQRLEKQAEQYKDDLKSSDASGAASAPSTTR
ncbi:MAG: hypothetical protein ABIY58_11975 [Acidimicrobiales bacterium]